MPQNASTIRLTPNCSLTPRGAAVFFASICAVTLGLAALCAARGFWPVVPFAGLELGLLGWALRASLRRRHHSQTITICTDTVEVEEHALRQRARVVFPRHWAQVKMRAAASPLHPSRLTIESHGRRCEIGGFLNDQERRGLAQRLRRLIGRTGESPQLELDDALPH
jgi:uncharacterized membrane protein